MAAVELPIKFTTEGLGAGILDSVADELAAAAIRCREMARTMRGEPETIPDESACTSGPTPSDGRYDDPQCPVHAPEPDHSWQR